MKRSASILAFALCLVGAFSQEADVDWFWGKPISAIEWIGATHADKNELDATVKPFVGKSLTEEMWSSLQAQVYALDWFETIEPAAFPGDAARTKVLIKFTVKEKAAVTGILISGNSGLRTTEILDVVQEKVGDIFSLSKSKLDMLAVKKLYLDKGYPDAKITSSTTATDLGVSLTFFVDEGSLVAIKEIRFQGLSAFKDSTIRNQLELKAVAFLQPGTFQESKLESDKQKVIAYYRKRGYADATIVDVTRSLEKDAKTDRNLLVLTFVLNEGKQWLYGGISFAGNKVFGEARLQSFFAQKKGAILDVTKLLTEKQAMDDLYYENGYIFNVIDLKEVRDSQARSIVYSVTVTERDRAHIESISFKGNSRTQDMVLAREIPLEVGDVFSKAKIIEGLRNLYNLQFFSAIEPQLLPGSDENLMDLVISVEEQSTADIQFGVTLSGLGANASSSTFPLSGLIKWNEKNFQGKGQNLGVELNASPTAQTVSLTYGDSWLFGKRISGGLNLAFDHKFLTTNQDLLDPIFDTGVPDPYISASQYADSTTTISDDYKMPYEYLSLTLGATGGYSRHTTFGDLGFSLGFASSLGLTEYDTAKYRPASKDVREIVNVPQWTNKIPFRAYLNNLDLWYNPGSGYYASQKLTFAGISSIESQHYIRSDSRLDAFVTLFNIPVFEGWNLKWVLGGHSALNVMLPQSPGGTAQVSPSDDIHIDGTFVGRGWTSLYAYEDGRALWDNWLELRMPIFDEYFWLDGFLDVDALQTSSGLVQIGDSSTSIDKTKATFSELGWNNLAMSMGFGIRFTIPQFPFRFYFAKRFAFDGSTINWTPAGSDGGMDFVISISQSLN